MPQLRSHVCETDHRRRPPSSAGYSRTHRSAQPAPSGHPPPRSSVAITRTPGPISGLEDAGLAHVVAFKVMASPQASMTFHKDLPITAVGLHSRNTGRAKQRSREPLKQGTTELPRRNTGSLRKNSRLTDARSRSPVGEGRVDLARGARPPPSCRLGVQPARRRLSAESAACP